MLQACTPLPASPGARQRDGKDLPAAAPRRLRALLRYRHAALHRRPRDAHRRGGHVLPALHDSPARPALQARPGGIPGVCGRDDQRHPRGGRGRQGRQDASVGGGVHRGHPAQAQPRDASAPARARAHHHHHDHRPPLAAGRLRHHCGAHSAPLRCTAAPLHTSPRPSAPALHPLRTRSAPALHPPHTSPHPRSTHTRCALLRPCR